MKSIALTGQPQAQDAAALYLQAAINGRCLPVTVRVGLSDRREAHAIHDGGGEIWLCGPEAPRLELVGQVDRVLPADSVLTLGTQVHQCLEAFLTKTTIT